MEILWICFALVCLLMAINVNIHSGFRDAATMYGCMVLSFMMYLWRRSIRRKEEEGENGKKMQ